jgi:uncharacterized protein (TIGR02284 family)
MDEKAHKTINELIRLDIDAAGAYRSAIEACEVRGIRRNLTEFLRDHMRHIRDLSQILRADGGKPATKRDVKGVFLKGFTSVMSQGDRSALLAMNGNERLTNAMYKSALEDGAYTREARQVIQANYADERRHLAWIQKALKERLWEQEERAEPVSRSTSASRAQPAARTVRRSASRTRSTASARATGTRRRAAARSRRTA